MKRSTTIALAFLALSGSVATAAYAQGGKGGMGQTGLMPPIESLDADKNGDITLEEFTKVADERFASADTDKDGKLTVAEVASAIEKMRTENMAKRIIARLDANDDGAVTAEEAANARKKMFAMLDKNDDGKIVASERPQMRDGKGRHGKHHGMGMNDNGQDGPDDGAN